MGGLHLLARKKCQPTTANNKQAEGRGASAAVWRPNHPSQRCWLKQQALLLGTAAAAPALLSLSKKWRAAWSCARSCCCFPRNLIFHCFRWLELAPPFIRKDTWQIVTLVDTDWGELRVV